VQSELEPSARSCTLVIKLWHNVSVLHARITQGGPQFLLDYVNRFSILCSLVSAMFKQRGLSRTDFPDEPQGRFREDLLYRLNVFTIKVPPLRKRTGDIRLLAQYFVDKYSQKIDRPMQGLSQEVLQCLENYPFPGNVRELENELERAVALAQDVGIIEFSCLSEKIVERSAMVRPELNVQGTLKEMVEALEKSVLSQLLEKHGGNRTRAAKELGLSRYGLMKKNRDMDFNPLND